MLTVQLMVVKEQILNNDRCILASARETELGRRLMEIPGVGPLLASAFVATVADPTIFRTGRDLAAWIGRVPKQHSSGGKERLGGRAAKVAAVALANKTARMVWALMTSGERYREPAVALA